MRRHTSIFVYKGIIIYIILVFVACNKVEEETSFNYESFIPSHFPMPYIHPDNLPTQAKIALGKKLFYDPVMSVDSSISCASCHNPSLSFSDKVAFSLGAGGELGTRNSPSLANVVYQEKLLREGGLSTLEMQVLVPIQEHNEFNFNILKIAERLNKNKSYIELSQLAFGRLPDPFVITRAISSFERILISGDSKYDQFINHTSAFTHEEMLGKELFFSTKTQCSSCHGTFLFTNQTFENNGLYINYPDEGRRRLTGLAEDEAKFKVPSLRNINLTAPYMHDGSIKTLEQVIDHYNSGGKPHQNKSNLIKPLNLNSTEKKALIAFLNTLTDFKFVNNKDFRNE